jgi:hypothetical protein
MLWSHVIDDHPNSDPYFGFSWGTNWQDGGAMDVLNNPSRGGNLQSPWLSIRLSLAVDEKYPLALQFLLGLAKELDMVLFDGDTVVTYKNINTLMREFFLHSDKVTRLFGRCSVPEVNH